MFDEHTAGNTAFFKQFKGNCSLAHFSRTCRLDGILDRHRRRLGKFDPGIQRLDGFSGNTFVFKRQVFGFFLIVETIVFDRIIVGNFGTAFIVFKFCRIAFFCIKADRYRTVFHNGNNLTYDAFITHCRNFFAVGRTRNTGADIVGVTHPAGKGSGIDLFKRGIENFCSLCLKFVKEHPAAVSADTLSTLDIHIDFSGERGRKGDRVFLPFFRKLSFTQNVDMIRRRLAFDQRTGCNRIAADRNFAHGNVEERFAAKRNAEIRFIAV